jgi:four helix bundle protein
METLRSHLDLLVWRKAMELVTGVYRLTSGFPATERFGLGIQLRRAVVSVPANIAEGSGRGSRREFAHFVAVARGSVTEVETLLLVARNLDYVPSPAVQPLLDLAGEVSRMLFGLRRSLMKVP